MIVGWSLPFKEPPVSKKEPSWMLDGSAEPFELNQYTYMYICIYIYSKYMYIVNICKYHGWMMFDTDYHFPRSVHQRWMF